MITRWRERKDGHFIIHAGPASGNDVLLCGYACEGECNGDDGYEEPELVTRGKISCPDCLAFIRHCKAIPSRLLAR